MSTTLADGQDSCLSAFESLLKAHEEADEKWKERIPLGSVMYRSKQLKPWIGEPGKLQESQTSMRPELAEDREVRTTDYVKTLQDLIKILLENSKYCVARTLKRLLKCNCIVTSMTNKEWRATMVPVTQ